MKNILNLKKELKEKANSEKAIILQKFFKTGYGEYGYGDIFIGVTVLEIRKISKKYQNIELKKVIQLLHSKIHEERMVAICIMIDKYQLGDLIQKEKIFKNFLQNTKYINNWDLVDISAPKIIGNYLLDKPKDILYKLALSENLWEKRIAIVATSTFIKKNNYKDTVKICKILLKDKHDLIHKATGWMLREVGKKDIKIVESFINENYKKIPRTMLRYAIEKFSEKKRKYYIKLK